MMAADVNENTADWVETLAVSIYFIILLGICAGIIFLQIFLSKKENKWQGLILPFISFGISLMALFAVLLFSAYIGTSGYFVDGVFIELNTTQITSVGSIIAVALYIVAIYNIPTVVLLAIYAACRGKRKKQRDLKIMSVQDL
jgi:predicted membrane protein